MLNFNATTSPQPTITVTAHHFHIHSMVTLPIIFQSKKLVITVVNDLLQRSTCLLSKPRNPPNLSPLPLVSLSLGENNPKGHKSKILPRN